VNVDLRTALKAAIFHRVFRLSAVAKLGSPLDPGTGSLIGRLAAVALLTLALVCWLARNNQQSGGAAGPVAAMLFYNLAAAALLVYARVGLGFSSIGLWPPVAVHAVLALWCIASLRTGWVKV
jgi:hypothetical protein